MTSGIQGPVNWRAGDAALRAEVDRYLASGLDRRSKLHHTPRRSVYRLGLETNAAETSNATSLEHGPRAIALKVHHVRPGARAWREAFKRFFLQSSARREWRALNRLHALGAAVPQPRAWGQLPSGDEIVVCDFIEGIPLLDCLPTADEAMQKALLTSLGESLAALYAEGFRHGDLHVGNLMVLPNEKKEQMILLDVQSARRSRREATRLADLARLELSLLRSGFSAPARAGLRAQLNVGDAFPRAYARFLKDYMRGRARRMLAVGRRTAQASFGARRGLRTSRFSNEALDEALTRAAEQPGAARRGGRIRILEVDSAAGPLVIKQIEAGSWRRALADRFRGSPAARAFHTARAQGLVEERAATPLAFVEARRFSLPFKSWLILERQGEQDLDALRLPPGAAQQEFGRAFGRWLAEGHALGLSHRDAKGTNLRVHQTNGEWRFAWVDLEDLTGPAPVNRKDRIRVWSQIGASLRDADFSLETRIAALDEYCEQMSYADGTRDADPAVEKADRAELLREIAEASLARNHRWRGEDCACLNNGQASDPNAHPRVAR